MVEKPKRITARRVNPFYTRLFKACDIASLLQLKAAISDGVSFDGKRYDTCIYGNLAKGVGYNFVGMTPDEITDTIKSFGKSIGIEIKADGRLDPVERFCGQASRGDSILTHSSLSQVESWIEAALMEKGYHPFQTTAMVGGEPIGV